MLPYLILVDLAVWIFYISKGFIGSKIKAELDIIKNKDQISKRYLELENKKTVPDIKLIETLSDTIFVPESVTGEAINRIFNSIISILSRSAKRSILSSNKEKF